MTKYVYFFGAGRAEGSSVMRNLLGGKGCELAEMTNLGIPVPPGFTITTQAWVHRQRAGRTWPDGLWEQILEHPSGWNRSSTPASVTPSGPCWSPCARARGSPCPA
jgi:phosphoenolpyruvate synthase/pyruvate phosphate dikinase